MRTTGLGAVGLDLKESERTVADDMITSGYSVTYRRRGNLPYSHLQSAIIPRFSGDDLHIQRHADRFQPFPIALTQSVN